MTTTIAKWLVALSSLGSTVVGIKGYFDPGTRPRPLPPIARPPTATKYGRALARRRAAARALARHWLCGALDAEVPVPITMVCDALGLDADALADVVRRRDGTNGRHERA